MNRERLGFAAIIVLAFYLIFGGAILLVGIAIPGWVLALLMLAAGILLLVGR